MSGTSPLSLAQRIAQLHDEFCVQAHTLQLIKMQIYDLEQKQRQYERLTARVTELVVKNTDTPFDVLKITPQEKYVVLNMLKSDSNAIKGATIELFPCSIPGVSSNVRVAYYVTSKGSKMTQEEYTEELERYLSDIRSILDPVPEPEPEPEAPYHVEDDAYTDDEPEPEHEAQVEDINDSESD